MWILCLGEDSFETSSLIFFEKQWKNIYELSSAAVVIGSLRVKNTLSCFKCHGLLHVTWGITTPTPEDSEFIKNAYYVAISGGL